MKAGLNASLELQCRETMEIRTKHLRASFEAGFEAGLEGLKPMEIEAKQYDKEGALFWSSKRKKKQARKNGPPQYAVSKRQGQVLRVSSSLTEGWDLSFSKWNVSSSQITSKLLPNKFTFSLQSPLGFRQVDPHALLACNILLKLSSQILHKVFKVSRLSLSSPRKNWCQWSFLWSRSWLHMGPTTLPWLPDFWVLGWPLKGTKCPRLRAVHYKGGPNSVSKNHISFRCQKRTQKLVPCTCLSRSWQSFPFCYADERGPVSKACNRGASRLGEAWPRPRLGRNTYWHKDKARLTGTRNYIILLSKSQQGWTWSSW